MAEAQEGSYPVQLGELLEEVGGAHGEPPSAKEIPSPGFTQRPVQVEAQSSTLGSQAQGETEECQRQQQQEASSKPGTCWRSPGALEQLSGLSAPGQESREEFRPRNKEEKLRGSFHEVTVTLVSQLVKEHTHNKRPQISITFQAGNVGKQLKYA